jgi:peptidoglycan/LPS O-acetylase OafA/YrhL
LNYRPDIDGLRALAVVPVVLFHARVPPFSGGFVGVDVFFVISGFLITSMITDDIQRGRFSIARFYERRIRRIFPALFAVLAGSSICAWILLPPHDFDDFAKSVFAASAFGSNVLFWLQSGYFDGPAHLKPLCIPGPCRSRSSSTSYFPS